MKKYKIKPLTKEQLIISADRLTRFKYTESKYYRVFFDIITNNLIEPKFKKDTLEQISASALAELVAEIINYSINAIGYNTEFDNKINKKIAQYEKTVFNFDKITEELLDNKINYKNLLNILKNTQIPNLKWLQSLEQDTDTDILRQQKGFLFPIKKVILVEGATELTLLPEFAKHLDYDFDKNGIYIISAGGKNQVVKLYYRMVEVLKLPMYILLDNDAKDNVCEIEPKLRSTDKIHVLKSGEFEDLLPKTLIEKTLKDELKNISVLEKEILNTKNSNAKILEEVFKSRGLHEFKKVEFAQWVKNNIKNAKDISSEIREIIREIENL